MWYIYCGGINVITKEKFCKAINQIRHIREYEDELYSLGRKYGEYDTEIRFPTLEDVVVSLLEDATCCPEDEYGSDISYFIYELDFGKDWEPGMIIDREGNDIDFSTVEKLYDYLREIYDKRTKVI